MYKPTPAIICVFLAAITLSGCGLLVLSPAECMNETPTTDTHELFPSKTAKESTKAEFLKDWGKPDEIVATAENEETWIYKKNRWCGVVPFFFLLPAPLVLPVCDGFDRITFQGNEATNLHTRRIVTSGFVVIMTAGTGFDGRPCRNPVLSPLPKITDAENAAEITVIRASHLLGGGVTYSIALDNKEVSTIRSGEYTRFRVSQGKHSLAVTPFGYPAMSKENKIDLTLEPKTKAFYSISCGVMHCPKVEMLQPQDAEVLIARSTNRAVK